MEREKYLVEQIAALEGQIKPLEEELREIHSKRHSATEEKVKRCESMQDKFTLEELRFSATARCLCGAGLAYPNEVGPRGSWLCSDILLGRAIPMNQPGFKEHTDGFPFFSYEIKSEDQPSAKGATTRPKE